MGAGTVRGAGVRHKRSVGAYGSRRGQVRQVTRDKRRAQDKRVQEALSQAREHEEALARRMAAEQAAAALTAASVTTLVPAPRRRFGTWELGDAIFMLRDGYHIDAVLRRTGVDPELLRSHITRNGRGSWDQRWA